MVFLTGDTHANFHRFNTTDFKEQRSMTQNDVVIILGDFGGIWQDSEEERWWLKWLTHRPFTLCFVDGNHENFDRLLGEEFTSVGFHGGEAKRIRQNIYYLQRGQIYDFEGKKFFCMGGASSHDIRDGILDPSDFTSVNEFRRTYERWSVERRMFRVNHLSWWKEELPDKHELRDAEAALRKNGMRVDYVLSHTLPTSVNAVLGYKDPDRLTDWFQKMVDDGLSFDAWFSGHLHRDEYSILGKYNVLYRRIERVL